MVEIRYDDSSKGKTLDYHKSMEDKAMSKNTKKTVVSDGGVVNVKHEKEQPKAQLRGRRIQVELKEYKNREFVDIRTYYQGDDEEWFPTQKGVTVDVTQLKAIIKCLTLIEADLK